MSVPDPQQDPQPDRPPDPPAPANAMRFGARAWIAPSNLELTYARSSGPGGQSVNKVNTRAQLRVALTNIYGISDDALERLRSLAGQRLTNDDEVLISSDTHRSQRANREECLDRFRELVIKALVPPRKRKRRRVPRAVKERRLENKRQQSEKKSRRGWNRGR